MQRRKCREAGSASGDAHERDRETERAERERDHRRLWAGARACRARQLLRAPVDLLLDPVGEAVDELRLELLADLLAGGERRLELVPELLLLGHSDGEHTAAEDLL